LIQTLIARGSTQQEFAARCGLEEDIQREADEYEQASSARICELAPLAEAVAAGEFELPPRTT
jgi:hypothetical protein